MAGRKSQRLRNQKSAANKDGKKKAKVKSKKETSKKAEPVPPVVVKSEPPSEEPQSWKSLEPSVRASLLSGSQTAESDEAQPRAPKAVKLLDSDGSDTESMSAPAEIPVRNNMYQENMYERVKSKRTVNPANLSVKPKPSKKAEKTKKEVPSRRNLRSNAKENKEEEAKAAETGKKRSKGKKKKGSSAKKATTKDKEEEKEEGNKDEKAPEGQPDEEEMERHVEQRVEEPARYIEAPLRIEREPEENDAGNDIVEPVETFKHRSILEFFKPAPKRPPMKEAVNFKRTRVVPAPEDVHKSISVGTSPPYWTSSLPEMIDDSTGLGKEGEIEQKSDKNSESIEDSSVSNLEEETPQVPEAAENSVEEISEPTEPAAETNEGNSNSEAPLFTSIESKTPELGNEGEMATQVEHDAPAPVEPELMKEPEPISTQENFDSPAQQPENAPIDQPHEQVPVEVHDLPEIYLPEQQQFMVTENHESQEDDDLSRPKSMIEESDPREFEATEERAMETSDYAVSDNDDDDAEPTAEEKAAAMRALMEGFDKDKLKAFTAKKVSYSNTGKAKHASDCMVGDNFFEKGLIKIRESFDFIEIYSDDEDEENERWNTGMAKNNIKEHLVFFATGVISQIESLQIACDNWNKFTVYGCEQMGFKIFSERFTENTLRAQQKGPNRKRKRPLEKDKGTGKACIQTELLPTKEIRIAQIQHKEGAYTDREAAKSKYHLFDEKTGEEIASMQFPRKIYHIVKDPTFHCMFWLGIYCDQNPVAEQLPDGSLVCTSFIINKRWARESRQVLDNSDNSGIGILFNTQNYQSLVRQLNLYGFRKVKRSSSDPTYSNYRHALSLTKHPQTGEPSNEHDIDEFRHSFFRERSDNKVLNIKRQKPFKPTVNVWRPPKFEKSRNAAARAQMRERERERMEMTPTYSQRGQAGQDDLSDKFMENNMVGHAGGVYLLPPGKASEVAKITGKKRPLQQINEQDGDDPEAAFGPQGSAS